jgi:hypothetical protein
MAIMTGIHNAFPADIINGNNPITEKKLLEGEGQYSLCKNAPWFQFQRPANNNVAGGGKDSKTPHHPT